jgi:hypothetical protein
MQAERMRASGSISRQTYQPDGESGFVDDQIERRICIANRIDCLM